MKRKFQKYAPRFKIKPKHEKTGFRIERISDSNEKREDEEEENLPGALLSSLLCN
jgi:hypothetical protein